jgi:hypothetical protein
MRNRCGNNLLSAHFLEREGGKERREEKNEKNEKKDGEKISRKNEEKKKLQIRKR